MRHALVLEFFRLLFDIAVMSTLSWYLQRSFRTRSVIVQFVESVAHLEFVEDLTVELKGLPPVKKWHGGLQFAPK